MKSIEHQFRDWEGHVFGYGYGSGEEHTLTALKQFLELCNEGSYGHSYSYETLEKALTPAVAWLLINILCHADIIEYGTSPRFAWLTAQGERLKDFVSKHTVEQLYEIAANHDENYFSCSPQYCNCGEDGYEEGRVCDNQFWQRNYTESKDDSSTNKTGQDNV